MHEPEFCPKCSAEFPARKAILSGGVRLGNKTFSGEGPAVKCPNCWNVFPAQNLRLFGFIPTHALRWVVLGILAVCAIISFVQRHGT